MIRKLDVVAWLLYLAMVVAAGALIFRPIEVF